MLVGRDTSLVLALLLLFFTCIRMSRCSWKALARIGETITHGTCAVPVDSGSYAFRSGRLCGANHLRVSVMLLHLDVPVQPCQEKVSTREPVQRIEAVYQLQGSVVFLSFDFPTRIAKRAAVNQPLLSVSSAGTVVDGLVSSPS